MFFPLQKFIIGILKNKNQLAQKRADRKYNGTMFMHGAEVCFEKCCVCIVTF